MASGETTILIKLEQAVDPGLFQRMVRESLALSSWCVASKPISIVPEPDAETTFRVSFFLIDPSYLPLAKDQLSTLTRKVGARGNT
jgi:hypothetical protein